METGFTELFTAADPNFFFASDGVEGITIGPDVDGKEGATNEVRLTGDMASCGMLGPADLVAVVAAVLFAAVVPVFGAMIEAVTAPSFLGGGGVKGVLPLFALVLLPFRFHSRRSFFSFTGISVGVAPLAAAAAASASSFFRKAAMLDIGGSAMML
jgi:hypothetical protein